MTATIKQALQAAIKQAMIAREKERLETLRLISAEVKQIEVDERVEPDDTRMLDLLAKMVKKRNDAVESFRQGGRQDLVEKELLEVAIISEFLPQPFSEDEVNSLVAEAIQKTGAKAMGDMGKVMNELRPVCNGRFDMTRLSALVKSALSS